MIFSQAADTIPHLAPSPLEIAAWLDHIIHYHTHPKTQISMLASSSIACCIMTTLLLIQKNTEFYSLFPVFLTFPWVNHRLSMFFCEKMSVRHGFTL